MYKIRAVLNVIIATLLKGDFQKTLLNLNFQKSTGQLEKTAEISKTKKNIARLYNMIGTKK